MSFSATSRVLAMLACCAIQTIGMLETTNADVITFDSWLGGSKKVEAAVQSPRELLRKGEPQLARKSIQSYCNANPDAPHPEVLFASALLSEGEGAAAVEVLEQFSRQEDVAFEAHLAFARVAILQQRWFDAVTHLASAKQAPRPKRWKDATVAEADLVLKELSGTVAVRRQDWKIACDIFGDLSESKPENTRFLIVRGEAAFHLGDRELMEASLRKAAEANDCEDSYELMVARLHIAANDVEAAEIWLQKATDKDRNAGVDFAEWLVSQNRPNEAINLLTSNSISSEDTQDRVKFVTALAFRMQRKYAEAEALLSRLHQATPDNWLYGNHLALVLIESNDEGKRARSLQIASANLERIQNADTVSTLAWIQHRLGNPSEGLKLLNTLVRTGWISRDTAYFLGEIRRSMGAVDEAEQLLKTAIDGKGTSFYIQKTKE